MDKKHNMKDVFEEVLGKRITGVQIREDTDYHSSQIFLTFDDNTYFEIYSDCRVNGIKHAYAGNMQTIRDLSLGNSDILVDIEQTN